MSLLSDSRRGKSSISQAALPVKKLLFRILLIRNKVGFLFCDGFGILAEKSVQSFD